MPFLPERRDFIANVCRAGLVLGGFPSRMGEPGLEAAQAFTGADVKTFGAVGDGRKDDSAAVGRAIESLSSVGGFLWFNSPGAYLVTGHLTIPKSINVCLAPGAQILTGADARISIEGTVSAGEYQVFRGRGVVQLSPGTVLPEWFGAQGGEAIDNGPAVQRALDSAAGGSRITFSGRKYSFSTGFRIAPKKTLTVEGTAGTELVMSTGFRRATPLISCVGAADARADGCVLRDFAVSGQGQRSTDGIGIHTDYTNGLSLSNLFLRGIRNSAVVMSHAWDATLCNVRVYGCGDQTDRAAALQVGQSGNDGLQNVNAIHASGVSVERSFGVGVLLEHAVNVSFTNCKFHGRVPTDSSPESSKELLWLQNSRLVRVVASEFSQARTNRSSGAVRVGDGLTTAVFTAVTFDRMGSDDTFAVFVSGTDSRTRIVIDSAIFNDERSSTPYVFVDRASTAAVMLGSSIAYASPQMQRQVG